MLSPGIQDMAEIDQSLPIQMQGLDSSASYIREAQNTRKIVVPSEVITIFALFRFLRSR